MKNTLYAAAILAALNPLYAQGTPEVEPNDTAAGATVLALGAQGDGSIGVSGDVDLWKITLAGSSDLRFWLNPGLAASLGDSDLALLAADGTTVLASNDDVSGSTNWLSRITAGGLAAGDYYLRVRSSATFDPTGTGTYTIDVIAAAPGTYLPAAPPLTAVAEAAENNDPRPAFGTGVATSSAVFTRNAGTTIAGGTSGTSATITGKDYDFYEVVVSTTGTHTFSTLNTPLASAPLVDDTVIRLFDSAFTSLAFNDDSGGAYSFLSYNITTPGTYYLCVSGYYGTSAGNYYLDILGPLPAVPTGAATISILPGGCGPTLGNRTVAQPVGSPDRTELAVLGSTYYLDALSMAPSAPMFRLVGLAAAVTPFDLGLVGGPAGCLVEVDPLSSVFGLADANGQYFWDIATPVDIGLIGLPLQQQVVALDPTLTIVASNRVASVCGISH